jgi:hypothetical protein
MWIFEGKEFIEVPDEIIGFVYLITNTLMGKRYIGKKLFTRSKTKQVKGKRKRIRVESDWKEYYGSNKTLLFDIASHGTEHFTREILFLCKSKGTCSYYEAKLQFQYGVLENPTDFYNDQIMCRIHRKHLKL